MQHLFLEFSSWYVILCILAALTAASLLYFRTKEFPETYKTWKYGLAFLRFLTVFLIAFLLLSPLWRRNITKTQKPVLVIAQDASSSVGDFLKKKYPSYLSEINELVEDLKKDYQVESFSFGESVRNELPGSFEDRVTNMSELLDNLSSRYAGNTLGGLILASDGLYNQGSNPFYLASNLATPVYTVGLGDTAVKKDLYINRLYHNQIVYAGDELEVQADLIAKNLSGKNTKLSLYEINGGKGVLLKAEDCKIDKSDYFKTVSMNIPAAKPGTRYFRLVSSSIEGEVTTINNSRDFVVTVLDGRQKILLLAQAPHPDLGALRQSLNANKNYEVKSLLLGDPLPDINEFDLIILHQLPAPGRNFEPLFKQIKDLGIAHWWIAGSQTDFKALNTFQDLITINMANNLGTECEAIWNRNFNLFQWEQEWPQKMARFPPLQVPFGDINGGKLGQTLLFQRIKNLSTAYPLLSLGEVGQVRSAVFVGDGLWKWRLSDFQLHENHEVFDGLTGKIVQYLSVKRDTRKFRIFVNKPVFDENEAVSFVGELYNASYELTNSPEVSLSLKNNEGKKYDFSMSREGKGYQLNAGILPVGNYVFTAKTTYNGKEMTAEGQFTV
ncbi:MAG: VWA domain-containing protein, partial [Bacteroidetes bacterium]|nr:VWA domain-containing protein [Bacteroidota bacterium]